MTQPPRPGASKPQLTGKPVVQRPTTVEYEATKPKVPGIRPPWYKRKYLVYPKFQMTLILTNALITFLLFCFLVFLVIRSHLYLENLVKQTHLPAQNLFIQLLTEQLRQLIVTMGISLGIGVVVTSSFTLLFSHRMAGPIIRLKNLFASIAKQGDFPEVVKFRDGDFFQELPPTINAAFNALKKRWIR